MDPKVFEEPGGRRFYYSQGRRVYEDGGVPSPPPLALSPDVRERVRQRLVGDPAMPPRSLLVNEHDTETNLLVKRIVAFLEECMVSGRAMMKAGLSHDDGWYDHWFAFSSGIFRYTCKPDSSLPHEQEDTVELSEQEFMLLLLENLTKDHEVDRFATSWRDFDWREKESLQLPAVFASQKG